MKSEQKVPKPTNKMIDLCLGIALKAHGGQHDIDGNPVILHPLTVGLAGETPEEQCAGFLHDVVEDTPYTFDDLLQMGVSAEIVYAIRLLTHDKSEPYLDYVRHIAESGNKIARVVKLNDVRHNRERGRKMGYQRLVDKHESAMNIFNSIEL